MRRTCTQESDCSRLYSSTEKNGIHSNAVNMCKRSLHGPEPLGKRIRMAKNVMETVRPTTDASSSPMDGLPVCGSFPKSSRQLGTLVFYFRNTSTNSIPDLCVSFLAPVLTGCLLASCRTRMKGYTTFPLFKAHGT